jgi:mycofactocin system glycosyltransferase
MTTQRLEENPSTRFPNGFAVRLEPKVARYDSGRVLVGGSPVRVVRLSDHAKSLFDDGRLEVRDEPSALLAGRLIDGNLASPVLDTFEVSPGDLTVVIPVRDRAEQLDRCLAAISPLRCLVIDDASHDPALNANVASRHGAEFIALTANRGPAGARNEGLCRVKTPYVAFIDSDVVVTADAILVLARHFADQQLALVAPLVKGIARSSRPKWYERYDAVASSLDLGQTGCLVRSGATVSWLPSACLVGRVAALGNGFDERLRVGEDVDLVWSLTANGWGVRYDPTQQALHDVRPAFLPWLERKFFYGTGGGELGRRHGSKIAPAVLGPVSAIAAAALLTRRWWSLPLALGAIVLTARSLEKALPELTPRMVPVRLAAQGLGWAIRQESALLLRHWWPVALLCAARFRIVRRALATAAIVDLLTFLHERPQLDPLTAFCGRRLDDISYGSGLWWGAITSRSLRCLQVRRRQKD